MLPRSRKTRLRTRSSATFSANDQDADGDTLTVTNAGTFNLAHGSLALKADGNYAYTLDNTNPAVNALNDGQTLTDAFTYQISDGHGGNSSAALTVTIHGTTDTPATPRRLQLLMLPRSRKTRLRTRWSATFSPMTRTPMATR